MLEHETTDDHDKRLLRMVFAALADPDSDDLDVLARRGLARTRDNREVRDYVVHVVDRCATDGVLIASTEEAVIVGVLPVDPLDSDYRPVVADAMRALADAWTAAADALHPLDDYRLRLYTEAHTLRRHAASDDLVQRWLLVAEAVSAEGLLVRLALDWATATVLDREGLWWEQHQQGALDAYRGWDRQADAVLAAEIPGVDSMALPQTDPNAVIMLLRARS